MKSKFYKKSDTNSDEEKDEIDDIITELSSVPKSGFSIPKPNKKSKIINYDRIDWKKYFTHSELIEDQIPLYWHGESGPSIICLHGAGHSGLSFAPLASYFNKYRIISFDFRGHGYNTMSEGEDLSNTSLISDTLKVIQYVNNKFPSDTMIIVGHSMGGSIATKACAEILKNEEAYPDIYMKIQGLIVIDVVEGTAKDALPFMESVVTSRPKSFRNTEGAIEFMYKSSTIRNLESARITVPPLVKEVNVGNKIIASWKTNLLASQKYWNEWFDGLTKCFLSIKVPKILLLAGAERMDKDLTIAQMQGKFKLSVIPDVGHLIHEDDPKSTFRNLDDFIQSFRIPATVNEIKPIVGKLGTNNPRLIKYEEANL